MFFYQSPAFERTRAAFGRAAGPFMIAGSLGLAGCSTVKTNQLNWDTCDVTNSASSVVGIPDVDIQGGGGVVNIITGLNVKVTRTEIQQDQLCPEAKRIIRATVIPQEGGYNPTGFAMLISFYTHPDVDPRLKNIVATRMRQEFGFGPEEVIKAARDRAEAEKAVKAAPAQSVCRTENNRRICDFDLK